MNKLIILIIGLVILSDQKTNLIYQAILNNTRQRCDTDARMKEIYKRYPNYKESIKKARSIINLNLNNISIRTIEEILTIPVHVVIVHNKSHAVGQGANIKEQRIHDQIERLNADFRKTNVDASQTPAVFPTVDSRIQFCLAQVDPIGNPSTGITRYGFNNNFDNNEVQVKTATGWDPTKYLNIWVAETIDGLGYAYLPSPDGLPDSDIDGAVVFTSAFGDGPELDYPYDKGRTATHEVGHYLGLDHIWGGGCNVDDGIEDTPEQTADNGGCPSHPSPSCNNNGDMFMNYMDYSDDACMFAFTPGQSAYMRLILETSRKHLADHGSAICSSSNGGECTSAPPMSGTISSGNYYVGDPIITGSSIANQAEVKFKSTISIDLKEGFYVPIGVLFEAQIGDCANAFNQNQKIVKK